MLIHVRSCRNVRRSVDKLGVVPNLWVLDLTFGDVEGCIKFEVYGCTQCHLALVSGPTGNGAF